MVRYVLLALLILMAGCVHTRDPQVAGVPGSLIISNLSAPSIYNNPPQVQMNQLGVGKLIYTDRKYVVTSLPTEWIDATYIQMPNAAKRDVTDPLLTFEINQQAEVCVGYDDRINSAASPVWLLGWTFDGVSRILTTDAAFDLHCHSFPIGTVSLGPNGGGSNYRMYMVIVR